MNSATNRSACFPPVSCLELNQTAAGRLDLTHVVPNSHDLSPWQILLLSHWYTFSLVNMWDFHCALSPNDTKCLFRWLWIYTKATIGSMAHFLNESLRLALHFVNASAFCWFVGAHLSPRLLWRSAATSIDTLFSENDVLSWWIASHSDLASVRGIHGSASGALVVAKGHCWKHTCHEIAHVVCPVQTGSFGCKCWAQHPLMSVTFPFQQRCLLGSIQIFTRGG